MSISLALHCESEPPRLIACLSVRLSTICLPHKDGGIPLKCPVQEHHEQAYELVLHVIPVAQAPSREAVNHFLKSFGMTRPTAKADALTTTPSRRFVDLVKGDQAKQL